MSRARWRGKRVVMNADVSVDSATGEDETYRGFQGENRKARRERLAKEEKARKVNGGYFVGERRGLGRI